MKVKIRRVKRNPIRIRKLCDPGLCDHAMYIGEGDFLCDCHPLHEYVAVMLDWEPTEYFLHCERKAQNVENDRNCKKD